jgi:hypothetical protein
VHSAQHAARSTQHAARSTQHAACSTQSNAKSALKKISKGGTDRGKKFPQLFGKKFLSCTFSKKDFCGVFELPLLRNAQ